MHRRRTRTLLTGILLVGIALLGSCASTGGTAGPTPTAATSGSVTPGTGTPTTDAPSEGWIDGEPDWNMATEHGGYAPDVAVPESASADKASGAVAATTAATTASETAASGASAGDASAAGGVVAQNDAPLRAGSVDDNADFTAFLDYLGRIRGLGVQTRDFDPTGRIVVSVTGTSGLPVAGAEVTVSVAGAPVATIRTTADGTARLLPLLYADTTAQSYDFEIGGTNGSAAPGGVVALTADAVGGAQAPVAVDVLFLLDATGSMGDEIDRLKTTIDAVAERIAALDVQPDVHFGMTLYRDLADTFVTKTFDFTGDIGAFSAAIGDVTADGGDDYPEAMDEGLADALSTPNWRDPSSTIQLVFLVADAPPQITRDVQNPYTASIVDAIARGVKIIPIASSESDDQAEAVFRQLAEATGGKFVFLSYGAGGAATGTNTDIESTDYEELSLDDLIVRFVGEELSALTGTAPVEPPPDTTVTTVPVTDPPGQ